MKHDSCIRWFQLPLLFALCCLGACGGSSLDRSLDGFYETLSEKKKQPCEAAWVEQTIDSKYFRLEAIDLMGTPALAHYDCESAEPSSCTDAMSFFDTMTWAKDGWEYRVTSASYSDACNVSINLGRPVKTAVGFDLERTIRKGVAAGVDQQGCDTGAIEAMSEGALSCYSIEAMSVKRID